MNKGKFVILNYQTILYNAENTFVSLTIDEKGFSYPMKYNKNIDAYYKVRH